MITIISPVFNAATYIRTCIQSVAEQHFEGLEHLIMDGGSTDGTPEIIQEMAAEFPHIRWVSEKDKGQSDAMNKGIELARNPVISFLNADDRYEPGAISKALTFFRTAPKDSFFVGNCRVLREDGSEYMINKPYPFDQVSFMLDYNFPFNPSAYFYHKSLHNKVGMYEMDDHLTMDIDFLLRLPGKANIVYVDSVLGNYVMVANSKTMKEISAGRNVENLHQVFNRYLPNLSAGQKIKLSILKKLGKNRGWIMYYIDHPEKLLKKIMGRK
jgi:glycosyltransferase involved in cell wall biosynthesis